MNEQTDQSILDELEHLIFDEHKIISYKWATNHFKIPIQKSKQILSKFNKKFEDRLFVHHLITGFKSLTIKHSNPYNSIYVSPKLRKKSKSRINTNTNTNSNSNDSYMNDSDDDDMTQSQDDGSIDQYQSVYAQKLCEDKKFDAEKSQFNKIVDIHIYCIARDEARNIKDFLKQQYEEDYHQQLKITTAWLSKQAEKYSQNKNSSQRSSHKKEINELSRYSQISFDQCTTVPSPQLNRALARTKQEIQEREKKLNRNKDNIKKQINFDESIENFKKNKDKNKNRNKTPPINDKLMGLKLNNDDAKSSSSSLSPNANANKNKVGIKPVKKKKNDIRGAFAKAQKIKDKQDHDKQSQNQQSQIEEEIEKQKKLTKRKKAGTINNFFNTEAEEKEKAKSKSKSKSKTKSKSSKKKAARKATKTKKKGSKGKKKKNEKIGSLKPARKRKRGAMEESNLIPIEYGSESSQDDEDMNIGYDGVDDDDEELEAIKRSFKPNRNKRRKVMVDSDEEDSDKDKDEDDDIDIDDNVENESPKKLAKRELRQMEHERELKERKNNFFGAAKNNPIRKKKKYKTVAHSYINDKGMFVTEDKKVTDDEDTDDDNEQKEKERVHKFQHIEYDEDDDIAMKNKENSVDKVNGKNSKKKKNKNTTNSKKTRKKKVTPKKRKNGDITSFFKKK